MRHIRATGDLSRLQDHVCLIDGRRVHYWLAGQGEPLLLIHGLAGSRLQWWSVMEGLSRHYRVCAMNFPGHGLSEPLPPPCGPEQYVSFARKFLDHLGWPSAHVVGNSAGGFMGILLALLHADRVRTLTINDTIVTLSQLPALYALALLPGVGDAVCKLWPKEGSRLMLTSYIRRPHLVPEWLIDELLEDFQRARAVNIPMIRTLPKLDLMPYLPHIEQPTLVMWGRHDSFFHVRHAYTIRDRIPGAKLHIIEQGAHVPSLDNPAEFCEVLTGFLGEHRGEPAGLPSWAVAPRVAPPVSVA